MATQYTRNPSGTTTTGWKSFGDPNMTNATDNATRKPTLTAGSTGMRIRWSKITAKEISDSNANLWGPEIWVQLNATPARFLPVVSGMTIVDNRAAVNHTHALGSLSYLNSFGGDSTSDRVYSYNLYTWGDGASFDYPNIRPLWSSSKASSYPAASDGWLVFRLSADTDYDFVVSDVNAYNANDTGIPAGTILKPETLGATVVAYDDRLDYSVAPRYNNTVAIFKFQVQNQNGVWLNWTDTDGKFSVPSAQVVSTKIRASGGEYTNSSGTYVPNYAVESTSSASTAVPSGRFEAAFTYQVDYPQLNVNGSSSVAPTNDPVTGWVWSWGDGSPTTNGLAASHTYSTSGTYNVTLTISTKTTKRSASFTQSVVVTAPVPPEEAQFFSMGLFFDDPGNTTTTSTIRMKPLLAIDQVAHNWTRNEVPTLSFSAPIDWAEPGKVKGVLSCDIVLRFNFGNGWIEPPNGRFSVLSEAKDPLNPQTMVQVTCTGVANDLSGVYFIGSYTSAEAKNNYVRSFVGVKAGAAITALIPFANGAKADGRLGYLQTDITALVDSLGAPWATTVSNLSVPPDTDGISLLNGLTGSGACDWYCLGNMLKVFNASTSGMRTSSDQIPQLVQGVDVNAAPQTSYPNNAVYGAYVVRSDAAPFSVTDTDTSSASAQQSTYRGRRYVVIQSDSAISTASALAVAKPTIASLNQSAAGEMTRELRIYQGMSWVPYRDYWVNDTVSAPGPDGKLANLTVLGVTMTFNNSEGYKALLSLGSIAPVNPLAAKVNSLSGGGGVSVGAVGERPPSASQGFIQTLVSSRITNDNGSIDAGTTSLSLEGGGAQLLLDGLVRSTTVYNSTASQAANVYVHTSGVLYRSTSASKYKLNIAEQDYGTAVLDLPIKTWFDKAACENFLNPVANSVRRQVGLIAEDLVDAGLEDLVVYNDATDEVEGIHYDRVALLLIPHVRAQRDDIADLRVQIKERDRVLEDVLTEIANLKAAMTHTSESAA